MLLCSNIQMTYFKLTNPMAEFVSYYSTSKRHLMEQ